MPQQCQLLYVLQIFLQVICHCSLLNGKAEEKGNEPGNLPRMIYKIIDCASMIIINLLEQKK
jgi:hypothetical protein